MDLAGFEPVLGTVLYQLCWKLTGKLPAEDEQHGANNDRFARLMQEHQTLSSDSSSTLDAWTSAAVQPAAPDTGSESAGPVDFTCHETACKFLPALGTLDAV